jgi:hypothetical protein
LTGGVDDPQPDRHAGKIAIRSEFLGSLSAFQLGRIAVTAAGPEDEGFDTPYLHFRPPRMPGPSLDSAIELRSIAEPVSVSNALRMARARVGS